MSIDLKFTEFKGASCVAKFSPQPSALSKIIFKLLCVFLFIFFANSSISATKNCTYKYRFSYHTGGGNFSWTNYYNSLAEACSTKFPSGYIGWVEDIPRPSADGQFCIYYSDVRGWGWAPLNTSEELYICDTTSTLTLSPAPNQKDPRPLKAEGKDGKSSYELIAKVMEGSTPKAGVAVTFKVDVIEKTGGHGHHDANRPKGSVPASGVTDGNGEIKLTFLATEVAGSHNITTTCDSCSNKTAVKKVDVLVPDLIPISPNPPQNADGSYKYAFTAVDPGHVGTSGGRQRGEYYLTTEALINLESLVREFATQGWGTIAFNDASLNWGGVYDINNNWRPPHSTHRKGEDIDISFTRAGNPTSKKKQSEFYDKFCEDKKVSIPFTILHHYQAIPHFHVYLTGQKQCAKTPN